MKSYMDFVCIKIMVPTFVKSRSKKHTTPTRIYLMKHLPNGIVSWNRLYSIIKNLVLWARFLYFSFQK